MTNDFSLNEENVATGFALTGGLAFASGVVSTVAIDMFMVGGWTAYSTLGVSIGIYATAGIGLIIAGLCAGIYIVNKSDWKYEDANEKAVNIILS